MSTTIDVLRVGDLVHHDYRKRAKYYVTEIRGARDVSIRRVVRSGSTYADAGDKRTYRAAIDQLTVIGHVDGLTPPGAVSAPSVNSRSQGSWSDFVTLPVHLQAAFRALAVEFEPERAAADGERRGAELARYMAYLNQEWDWLETHAGMRFDPDLILVSDSRDV